jgi:putative transposase
MPPIRPELLDELLKDYQKPEDLLGQDGLLQQLTKARWRVYSYPS